MSFFDKLLKQAAEGALVKGHVSEEVKQRRLSICRGESEKGVCPMYKVIRGEERCLHCACYLEIKAGAETNINPKTMEREITHCPRFLWDDEQLKELYNH